MATRVGEAEVLVSPELDRAALARINAQILASLQKNLSQAFKKTGEEAGAMFSSGAARGIRSGETAVKTGADRMIGHLKEVNKAFRSAGFEGYLMGQALTRAFTLPIVAAVGFGNAFGISVAATLERTQVALKALLPPGYDVESLIKRLQQLAIESPVFNVAQVTQFTRQLVGAGVEGKRAVDVVEALGRIFLAYGLSTEDAERATRGVYQAFAKGRLYAEELNQQISENLPATFLFAKAAQRLGLMTEYLNTGQQKAAISTEKLALKQRELAIYQEKIAKSGKPMTDAQKLHIDRLKLQIVQLARIAEKDKAATSGAKNLQGAFLAMVKEGKITSDVLDDIIIEVGKLPEIARGSAAAVSTMSFAFDRLKDAFQNAFANAFLKFSPQIQKGLNELTANAQEFAEAIISTTPGIINFLNAVITKLTALIRAYNDLSPSQQSFVKQALLVLAALGPIAFIMGRVATVLGGLTNLMMNSARIAQYLGKTYKALTVYGYAAAKGTTVLARAVLLLSRVIGIAFAAAASTVGIIVIAIAAVIAAIVILYFKWKPFHDLVNATGRILKTAVIKTFNALKTAFFAVGDAAVWFYQNGLYPTWQIFVAIGNFIKTVALAVFAGLKVAFNAVAGAIATALEHARPFFIVIQTGFLIVAKIVEIAFRLIQVAIYWLGRLFSWLWNHVIYPFIKMNIQAFADFGRMVGHFLVEAWNVIYRVFFKPWVDMLRGPVLRAISFFQEKLGVIWMGMKLLFKVGWEYIKQTFIDPLRQAFSLLPGFFRGISRGIGIGIDAIGDFVLAAAQRTVRVLNSLIKIINKIPGIHRINTLGMPGIGTPAIDPRGRTSGQQRGAAKGTPPRGAPPGWMWVGEEGPELMFFRGGEHVVPNPESVALSRQMGGFAGGTPDWLDFVINPAKNMLDYVNKKFGQLINQGAHSFGNAAVAIGRLGVGGLAGMVKKFFGTIGSTAGSAAARGAGVGLGGLQPAILGLLTTIRRIFGNVPLISGFRPGARTLDNNVSYHASGRAIDISPVHQWALIINRLFGNKLKELITPWNELNILNGRPHRYTGKIWNQHNFEGGNAHIHAALDNGGWIPPGLSTVLNRTGQNEMVLNPAQAAALTSRINGDGVHVVEVYLDGQLIDAKITTRIERNQRDRLFTMKKGV